jgi:hypothetical protein
MGEKESFIKVLSSLRSSFVCGALEKISLWFILEITVFFGPLRSREYYKLSFCCTHAISWTWLLNFLSAFCSGSSRKKYQLF